MSRPSCKYLTHKHASFHGCTLQEMAIIAGVYIGMDLVIATLVKLFVGKGFVLSLLILIGITFFVLIKATAKRLGKMRKGKPAGYLTLRWGKFLHDKFGVAIPYVTRNGQWMTKKEVK